MTLPLACTSCFTMALWGFELEDEYDYATGTTESSFAYTDDTEWTWELFGMRLLMTPFAVGLDLLTAPVQCVMLGDDDDC